jgi:hypothetical protein
VSETIIFVDYENVATFDPAEVPDHARVVLFLGKHQTKFGRAFLAGAVKLGPGRLECIEVDAAGRDVLDNHLACHLGEAVAKLGKSAELVVLSKDQGFAPLVQHLNSRGFHVKQVDKVNGLEAPCTPAKAATDELERQYQHVLNALSKRAVKHLPTSRTKLTKEVANLVKGKGVDDSGSKLVKRLSKEGRVKESGKELVYAL